MRSESFSYQDGDTECIGFVAYNETNDPAPAVMIVHDWSGCGAFDHDKARAMVDLGYVGFAIDVYGEGRQGSNPDENGALMQPMLDDRSALGKRLHAAVAAIREHPAVDPGRIAAMGYCFGGLCVLDMARAGTGLTGVISNHGLLMPPAGVETGDVQSKVLVLHGHADPMVPPEQVLAFETEMTDAGADWQLHAYGNTYHSFTNPDANDLASGIMYNADAKQRAWQTTVDFLSECFV